MSKVCSNNTITIEDLVALTSPWPFAKWGMDIVGLLPKASGNRNFLLVAMDYFTKWIEAKPLAKVTKPMVDKFVWRNIITRFGVPFSIISNNGSQFHKKFKAFRAQYKIRNYYSTLANPPSNG